MRITSKGQVTIPQEIRKQCGLLPHTQLRFVVEDGRVLIEKEPAQGSPGSEGLQRLRRARLRTRLRGFPCVLDVITADPLWQAWSEEQLSRWLDRGPLLINPIVYAEIAFACEAIETVDDLLTDHLDVYRLTPAKPPSWPLAPTPNTGPAPPRDSSIEQPQGLTAANHRLAAQAAIEAHQPAAVVHRKGQQVRVGELACLQQPGSIDADWMEQADRIGPELVLGMADQFGHHGRHHRRRPRTVGVARLAQDPQHGVLGERAGGPAVGLSGGEPAMGWLVMDMAPIQQGDQHVHIEQGNTHGCVPSCLRDCVTLRAGSLKPIRPEGC